jgi:hypothetical protein
MSPNYPKYVSQPNGGRLPSMCEMGPPDLRPTSGTADRYQRKIDLAHGRFLAGLGSTSMDDGEPAYAFNELAVMAEMDDIQGNGIFDPHGSQKNVHPGAGVFATNYSLPGMHARERPFGFSEERDITTGRPIRAVPSGAVANDSSAQIAFLEQGLYPRPQPMVGLAKRQTPFAETWNTLQNPVAIGEVTPEQQRQSWSATTVALLGIGTVLLLNELRKAKVL